MGNTPLMTFNVSLRKMQKNAEKCRKIEKTTIFYLTFFHDGIIIRTSTDKNTNNKQHLHIMDNTKNSIINLTEYNIDPSTIAGFLNERLFTDCHSFLIYNVNGKKAMAVSVDREFRPDMDAYFCINNIEQYRAPIKLVGKPFEVELNRGNWGKWCYDFIGGFFAVTNECKPGNIVNDMLVVDWGHPYIRFARLLPSGKPARKFHKYGQIEEHCGQFHDYNF